MSHQRERKEKDCLNCGTEVKGRYCHVCGQENVVPHQDFWSLAKHFIYDIFHFDGKFFDTLSHLFFRPGQVPAAYVKGKRTSYLDPIRMYLFTSAVFFLIFFSTQKFEVGDVLDDGRYLSKTERFDQAAHLYAQRAPAGSEASDMLAMLLDTTKSLRIDRIGKDTAASKYRIVINNVPYAVQPEVDSMAVDTLKAADADWMDRTVNEKWRTYKSKYGDDVNGMLADFIEKFVHWFPYMLFVSLPFFALILKLLYNRQKRFFYSDHAVFTLYHYIFSFLLLLVFFGADALHRTTGWNFLTFVTYFLAILWMLHLLLALKTFYKQGWLLTAGKFLLLNLLGFVSLIVIFVFFIFLFIFQL